jgi:hypothetical protein
MGVMLTNVIPDIAIEHQLEQLAGEFFGKLVLVLLQPGMKNGFVNGRQLFDNVYGQSQIGGFGEHIE